MLLTEQEVVPYLLKRRLIDPKAVVEGEVTVVNASRRNRVFKVISEQGPCYLLKQAVDREATATVAHEAAVYRYLQRASGNGGFVPYLPGFHGYDDRENILILEYLHNALSQHEYISNRGRFSTAHAKILGKALGALHSRNPLADNGERLRLSQQPPWALSIHQPDMRIFREVSSTNLQLIKILQQFTEFSGFLDELRRGWKPEALIHHDLKWDNCLIHARVPSKRKTRLKIVDWEPASVGDACWDVGSVFNDYFSFWLMSIPITGETPPERFLELARYPLEKMQPAIRAFWQAYTRRRRLDNPAAARQLARSVRFSAARLVQTAYEQMQMSMQLTGNIICFLQLSLNILKRPREAGIQLLGIPLQGLAQP